MNFVHGGITFLTSQEKNIKKTNKPEKEKVLVSPARHETSSSVLATLPENLFRNGRVLALPFRLPGCQAFDINFYLLNLSLYLLELASKFVSKLGDLGPHDVRVAGESHSDQ